MERGGRAALFNLLVHPPFRFIRMYILQMGVRDGYAGLVLCPIVVVQRVLEIREGVGVPAPTMRGVHASADTTPVTCAVR